MRFWVVRVCTVPQLWMTLYFLAVKPLRSSTEVMYTPVHNRGQAEMCKRCTNNTQHKTGH